MNSLASLPRRSRDPFQQFVSTVLAAGSSETTLARLARLGQSSLTRRGSPASLHGDDDQFVFIVHGATKLAVHVAVGREQILGYHFAGEFISLPGRGVPDYTLFAICDCELIAFPAGRFLDAVSGEAPILAALLDQAELALRRARTEAIMLGRKSAQGRVADFLVAMAERIGTPDGDGVAIELPMSRRDMADTLGLTIETVSRQISELRLLGVIETRGRSFLRLRNLPRLAARAGRVSRIA